MKKIIYLIIFNFISNFIFADPFNVYYFAKNYTSKNSETVLDFFELNVQDINKQDENGDIPLHIHLRYLLENIYKNIDLNLLYFLAKNSDLFLENKFYETPINMILDKFYNLDQYKTDYNFNEDSLRLKLFAILNCLLDENWYLDFQGLGFLKKLGCEHFHRLGFYNIVLFLINKIAFNILSKGFPLYKSLKKVFKYEESSKSKFLRRLYGYACIINEFYVD